MQAKRAPSFMVGKSTFAANSPVESNAYRSNLYETIRKTLKERRNVIDNLANNSFDHTNGFRRITLMQYGDEDRGERLRLHAWNVFFDSSASMGMIHSHSWDFKSRILLGRLKVENWSINELSDRDDCLQGRLIHLPSRLSARCGHSMRVSGKRWSAMRVSKQVLDAGMLHCGRAEGFHRVGPEKPSDQLVTLVHQGEHRRTFSDIFTEHEDFCHPVVSPLSRLEYLTSIERLNVILELNQN